MGAKLVSQYCKHCDTHNDFFFDVEKNGYKAFCPKCGKPLILCDECIPAEVRNPQDCDNCKFKKEA